MKLTIQDILLSSANWLSSLWFSSCFLCKCIQCECAEFEHCCFKVNQSQHRQATLSTIMSKGVQSQVNQHSCPSVSIYITTHIYMHALFLSHWINFHSPIHSDQKQPFTDTQSTVSRICSTTSICHSRYVDCYQHMTDDASSTKLVIMKIMSFWQITELDVDQSCDYATHGDEEMSFSVANFQMMSITVTNKTTVPNNDHN